LSNDAVAALLDTSEVASLRATIPYRMSPVTATADRKKDWRQADEVGFVRHVFRARPWASTTAVSRSATASAARGAPRDPV